MRYLIKLLHHAHWRKLQMSAKLVRYWDTVRLNSEMLG
jgi:hypothetical protein